MGSRVIVVAFAVLVTGCAPSVPPVPPGTPGSSPDPASSIATVPSTAPPVATATAPRGGTPPDAALLVPDGDPVVGQLGSYTWAQAGSDSPWLPGTPAVVDGSAALRFGLSFHVPVAEWHARYAASGEPAPGRPVGLAAGAIPLEVAAPPAGSWALALTVVFAGGRGDATYHWRVDVR